MQQLTLECVLVPGMMTRPLPHLQTLDLRRLASWDALGDLPPLTPALHTLRLDALFVAGDLVDVVPALERWPRLRVLDLHAQLLVRSEPLHRLLRALPRLVDLTLSEEAYLTPEAVEVLATCGQRLQALRLGLRGATDAPALMERLSARLAPESLRFLWVDVSTSRDGIESPPVDIAPTMSVRWVGPGLQRYTWALSLLGLASRWYGAVPDTVPYVPTADSW